jgi:hypothetical protein
MCGKGSSSKYFGKKNYCTNMTPTGKARYLGCAKNFVGTKIQINMFLAQRKKEKFYHTKKLEN